MMLDKGSKRVGAISLEYPEDRHVYHMILWEMLSIVLFGASVAGTEDDRGRKTADAKL